MATKKKTSFDERLVLFRFFLSRLKLESLPALAARLNSDEFEGLNDNGNTYFCDELTRICRMRQAPVTAEQLRCYDDNICRHTRRIGDKRGGIRWKYFQYLSLLFTEMYLDRYFADAEGFCDELNDWRRDNGADGDPFTPDTLNKVAFMSATGSGKTLLMHMNILQFRHYFDRARLVDRRLTLNKVIVLSPNEGMSRQHLDELTLSSVPAVMFDKNRRFADRDEVIVIDMNKLKEEGKVKTVSVDSFERNNLVLVDEGHRGLSGDVWHEYRTRLSEDGFAFEYSATFRQALSDDRSALTQEYERSILMDYSYKYFYHDGYGKDFRIVNLEHTPNDDQQQYYLIGCLLSFYQQLKVFGQQRAALAPFGIEKPLLVFVGNRVTAPIKKSSLNQSEKNLLTDVEEVLMFLDTFVRDRKAAVDGIRAVLSGQSGIVGVGGRDLFADRFAALRHCFGNEPDPLTVWADVMRTVFNTASRADAPRLHLDQYPQVAGEIGLKIGADGDCFGVISIGDTTQLLKNCAQKGLFTAVSPTETRSLFRDINAPSSPVNILIGSRKFTEGWNSLRVSTMGLINFAKGEGSQAIQLFGRGVRLKGYDGCLKRSSRAEPRCARPPFIDVVETLTVFGVKAHYMDEFRAMLLKEDVPVGDNIVTVSGLTAVDIPAHLYTPLIAVTQASPRLHVSPVALNEDELRFTERLRDYLLKCDTHPWRSLHLLRNKSKVGMGFFEAGNFYPDFILWITTDTARHLAFIDPKGLLHIRPDDPKITFCRTIKTLEDRLAPTADGRPIVLHSFIMSGTPAALLRQHWGTDRTHWDAHHVFTLDDPDCIECMLGKILSET